MSIASSKYSERIKELIRLAIDASKPRKYVQSIELIVTFSGIDVKKQQEFRFRDTVFLPKGLGKNNKICMVLDDTQIQRALELGVYRAISKSELSKIDKKTAKRIAQECDWVLVRADLMSLAGRILGPALGPRGKTPIAIPPTANIENVVAQYRNATRLYSKEQPWVGCRIGTEKMSIEDLTENAIAVLHYIEEKIKKPLFQVARIYIKTTTSPALEL